MDLKSLGNWVIRLALLGLAGSVAAGCAGGTSTTSGDTTVDPGGADSAPTLDVGTDSAAAVDASGADDATTDDATSDAGAIDDASAEDAVSGDAAAGDAALADGDEPLHDGTGGDVPDGDASEDGHAPDGDAPAGDASEDGADTDPGDVDGGAAPDGDAAPEGDTDADGVTDGLDADDGADSDLADADADAPADDASDTAALDSAPIDVISFAAATAPTQVAAQQVDLLALPPAAFTDVTPLFGYAPAKDWVQCVAVGDTDGDGDDDVVLMRKLPTQQMQIVAIELSTTPQPFSVISPIDVSLLVPTSACKLVDIDADGDADLLMGGGSGLALYTNVGGSKFVDASATLLPPILTVVPTSIAPADYDGDGDIDLFVGGGDLPGNCSSTVCKYTTADFACTYPPGWQKVPSSQDRMLRNDNGVFTDVTAAWSIPNDSGYMSTAADIDLDLDGFPDVLVGNDFGPQSLLRNNGKSFVEQGPASGVSAYGHAMGWGIGDLDGDGWEDLVQTDIGPGHLWQRKPAAGPLPLGVAPVFVDRANDWGLFALTYATSSWSPLLHDFDRDGDLDIYLGIATFIASPSKFESFMAGCSEALAEFVGVDLLIRNDLATSGGFAAARVPSSTKCAHVAFLSQALVDIDGDGDLDVVQVRPACNEPFGQLRVLRNDLVTTGLEVRMRLQGKGANREAIGARVNATLAGKPIVRHVAGNQGSGGGGTRVVHIGLGAATKLDDVKITWPDGSVTNLGSVTPNGIVVIKQP